MCGMHILIRSYHQVDLITSVILRWGMKVQNIDIVPTTAYYYLHPIILPS
jgi:hypothetical protein